jgi:hypothetical protein
MAHIKIKVANAFNHHDIYSYVAVIGKLASKLDENEWLVLLSNIFSPGKRAPSTLLIEAWWQAYVMCRGTTKYTSLSHNSAIHGNIQYISLRIYMHMCGYICT